jgi:hypothetical protein
MDLACWRIYLRTVANQLLHDVTRDSPGIGQG